MHGEQKVRLSRFIEGRVARIDSFRAAACSGNRHRNQSRYC
jgi:hypothetical protein